MLFELQMVWPLWKMPEVNHHVPGASSLLAGTNWREGVCPQDNLHENRDRGCIHSQVSTARADKPGSHSEPLGSSEEGTATPARHRVPPQLLSEGLTQRRVRPLGGA